MVSFIVDPLAREKLKENGIEDRIKSSCPIDIENLSAQEIGKIIGDLHSVGYFSKLPREKLNAVKAKTNIFLSDPKLLAWKTQLKSQYRKFTCELSDIMIFSGALGASVITPDEVQEYANFGFNSEFDFLGTVGAMMRLAENNLAGPYGGYIWQKRGRGRSLDHVAVSATSNLDPIIRSTGFLKPSCFDPFYNFVSYRPLHDGAFSMMLLYEQAEPDLLIAVLKYIDQLDIPVEFKNDKGRSLIEKYTWIAQENGVSRARDDEKNPQDYFIGYDKGSIPELPFRGPLPSDKRFPVLVDNFSAYIPFINRDQELAFCFEDRPVAPKQGRRPVKSFAKEDAQHLVEGLLSNAASGRARTSHQLLLGMIEHYFSRKN